MLLDHARIAKQAKITESEVASCGERAGEVPRIVKWKTIALETPHDVVGELTKKYGADIYPFCKDAFFMNGHWKVLESAWPAVPGNYLQSKFREVGEGPPDTWADLLERLRCLARVQAERGGEPARLWKVRERVLDRLAEPEADGDPLWRVVLAILVGTAGETAGRVRLLGAALVAGGIALVSVS